MSKMLILKTNGSIEVKDYPSELLEPSLSALQQAVDGYVEFIHLNRIGLIMVVNGEGKVFDLPRNPVASYFFWRDYGLDGVFGDVAFVSNDLNEVGDPIGLTEQQVADLKADIGWRLDEIEETEFNNRLDRDEYIRESEGE